MLNYGITGFNSFQRAGVITNHGSIVWEYTATMPWNFQSSSLENASDGLIDLKADGSFTVHSGSPDFRNYGILRKSGGTGDTSISVPFTNNGTIDVATGRLGFY